MTNLHNITNLIETKLDQMSKLKKSIANYFISMKPTTSNLSLEAATHSLHISPSTLTRFAKKCGFASYREFVFEYQNN